jgi:hypothetical protein
VLLGHSVYKKVKKTEKQRGLETAASSNVHDFPCLSQSVFFPVPSNALLVLGITRADHGHQPTTASPHRIPHATRLPTRPWSCLQLAQAIRAAQAAKERGRELQERGALESDVFLLFSDKYALEGDQEQGTPPPSTPPCVQIVIQQAPLSIVLVRRFARSLRRPNLLKGRLRLSTFYWWQQAFSNVPGPSGRNAHSNPRALTTVERCFCRFHVLSPPLPNPIPNCPNKCQPPPPDLQGEDRGWA